MAVFAKTVETGSFRGAARALGLSPSVVSHHVAQLESALDVALLYRTTRQLRLTDDGAKLLAAARDVVAAAERGVEALALNANDPSGQLAVAVPASLISEPLFAQLAAFATKFPRVALRMHFSDVQVDIIREGIDVALRAGSLKDSSLKSKKLFAFPRTLVAAPAYADPRRPPRTPRDLVAWDWIRLASRPPVATFVRGRRRQQIELRSRLIVDNGDALLRLARHGAGLAMVPTATAAADLAAGSVVEILPEWRLESPNVYAVWPANAARSSLTMRLVAFLGTSMTSAT